MSTELTGAVPILRVNNLDASIDYYVNELGFTKRWAWPYFASVGRDDVAIFLCQGGQGQPGTWISVFMKDVMPLYEEYKKGRALIAANSETVDLGIAAQAWIQISKRLIAGETVGQAVSETNTWLATPIFKDAQNNLVPATERWTVIGDPLIKIN